jgi:alanyl-tRNA synthetase
MFTKIVGDVPKIVGGSCGSRHMATAGGKDVSKIDEALAQVEEIVEK